MAGYASISCYRQLNTEVIGRYDILFLFFIFYFLLMGSSILPCTDKSAPIENHQMNLQDFRLQSCLSNVTLMLRAEKSSTCLRLTRQHCNSFLSHYKGVNLALFSCRSKTSIQEPVARKDDYRPSHSQQYDL